MGANISDQGLLKISDRHHNVKRSELTTLVMPGTCLPHKTFVKPLYFSRENFSKLRFAAATLTFEIFRTRSRNSLLPLSIWDDVRKRPAFLTPDYLSYNEHYAI
jgi:hypothetical protein